MQGAKPALQKRSRETRDKLVAALDRLLKTAAFETITVAQIAAEAGVSVGAVYNRFANKDAFIPVLFELYRTRINEHGERVRAQGEAHPPANLRETLKLSMAQTCAFMKAEGHLLRAVHMHSRLRPDLIEPDWEALVELSLQSVREVLEAFKDEIAHPDPDLAARTMTYFLNTALIEALIYPEVGVPAPHVDMETLAAELADYAWRYLTVAR